MNELTTSILDSLSRVDLGRVFRERGMWIDEIGIVGKHVGQLVSVVYVEGGFAGAYGKFQCNFAIEWRELRENPPKDLDGLLYYRACRSAKEAAESRGTEHPAEEPVVCSGASR